MILKTTKFSGNKFPNYTDLRDLGEYNHKEKEIYSYVHLIPVFTKYKDRLFRLNKEKVNICTPECSCEFFRENANLYENPHDIRALCPHLIKKIILLNKDGLIELDKLTRLLLENQLKYGAEELLKIIVDERGIYFGLSQNALTDWINVYSPIKENEKLYFNYSFNAAEMRWKQNLKPAGFEDIEKFVASIKLKPK